MDEVSATVIKTLLEYGSCGMAGGLAIFFGWRYIHLTENIIKRNTTIIERHSEVGIVLSESVNRLSKSIEKNQ